VSADAKHQGWMLLKASEDGCPMVQLDADDLKDLLANPANWGVTMFAELSHLPTDPNYWQSKVGVLIRYEVVVPEPAGIYKLPEWVHG
jgi:hypothetical protein